MVKKKKKNLTSILDLTVSEINQIFSLTRKMKSKKSFTTALKGKILGLVFQKPSLRTRISFEAGMYQLGGRVVYLGPGDAGLDKREPVEDIARILSGYLDGIVARTFSQQTVDNLAEFSTIPVINGLSNLLHPCQVLSDIYTIKEKKKTLKGLKVAFIGDGNNVCRSLIYAAAKLGINLTIVVPKGYEPGRDVVKKADSELMKSGSKITVTNNPFRAINNADIIYTDVWVSMGDENSRAQRLKDFKPYQLNSVLFKKAKPDCLVMHCLPAHRGEEITAEIIDGPNSIVFDQAENKLHVQKAILLMLLNT
ncbi:MAG: ornithine carbamoyltransferase, partial [Candidatus Omnitrophota bacterium]|nr:ornithine carbamoyltransferase [Candidatus Omnitrophota bacterium]